MKEIDNNNIEFELEQMKEQIHELKRIVGTKDLVNQSLMRQVVASKSKWIRRYNVFQFIILLPFIFLSFFSLKYVYNMSWLFYWATVAMCTVSVVTDLYINRLSDDDYSSMPLLELMTRLIKRQKNRRIQMLVSIPIFSLWCVWYIMEIQIAVSWIFILIGGVSGAIIGFWITHKAQRTDAAAVRNLRKLMEE